MNIHPDDPKWTAYVLGELHGTELEEVERELESSAEAREIVDDIRMMSTLLKDELVSQAPVSMTHQQHREIRAAAAKRNGWFGESRWVFAGFAGAAALAVLILAVILPNFSERAINLAEPEQIAQKADAPAPSAGALLPQDRANNSSVATTEQIVSADQKKVKEANESLTRALIARDEELAKSQSSVSAAEARGDAAAAPRVAEITIPTEQKDALRQQYSVQDAVAQQALQAQIQAQAQQGQLPQASPAPPPQSPSAQSGGRAASVGNIGRLARPAAAEAVPMTASPSPSRPAAAEADSDRRRELKTESYDRISDNPFQTVVDSPVATFSIDVDTAAYSNVRRFLTQNQRPPRDSVRIEELVNYFSYDYAPPRGTQPIAVHAEVASAPWKPENRLVRVGIKAKDIDRNAGTVVKDVKIEVDFNSAQVNAYRLIGYENRVLQSQNFTDDTKDAGDMGAGQTVTALFEIVPRGVNTILPQVDASKYQERAAPDRRAANNEMLTVRVRYKESDASDSTRFDVPLVDRGGAFENASADFRFAAAVAEFGMVLRDSPHKGQGSLDQVLNIAERSKGRDEGGYREEFVRLVRRARQLR